MCGVAVGSYDYWNGVDANGNSNWVKWMNLTGHPIPAGLSKGQKWLMFGLADLCGGGVIPLCVINSG